MPRPTMILRSLAAILAPIALAGCNTWLEPATIIGATTFGPIQVMQRTPGDLLVSLISGRDCSVVRLDKQLSYCKPPETLPDMPYCTRSLGRVDCWTDPLAVRPMPPNVADAPSLTAQQEKNRRETWLERQAGF
jgi:hypothetical protein